MGKPKIRFKGFDDDWEQRKFADFTWDAGKRNKEDLDLEPYAITNEHGFIRQCDAHDDFGYMKDTDRKAYNIVQPNSFAYNPARINVGSIGYYKGVENVIVSSLYEVFQTDNYVNDRFLWHWFKSDEFPRWIERLQEGSVRLYFYYDKLCECQLYMPSLEEQEKMASFLDALDHLITLHQRKCDETKKLKKYMLQKMFPQNGQTVPEIRFSGFTDVWEQRKFGELAEYKKGPFGSAITKSMFVPKSDDSVKVYEQQNAINKDWSLERYFLPKEYAYTKLKAFEVHGGDIIVSCAGTIGEIYEIPDNAEYGVINQALMRVRVDEKTVDKRMFIIAFSNMINEFTRTHSNGSAIKNIPPFADLKPMKVLMPSMEEQRVISEYFEKMDHLITLHQQKCDELRNIKKFMLQNMFA